MVIKASPSLHRKEQREHSAEHSTVSQVWNDMKASKTMTEFGWTIDSSENTCTAA